MFTFASYDKKIKMIAVAKAVLFIFFILLGTSANALTVQGNARYQKQVQQCLDLLKTKAPSDYNFISQHIGIIKQNSRSGMRDWLSPPQVDMSDVTAFYSVTWCAGSIAHDAYHSYLYQKYQPATGGHPAYDKWAGFEAERQAIAYQIKVMEKIGAAQHEMTHLKSQDGTHGDVNKDGKITAEDYQNRTW